MSIAQQFFPSVTPLYLFDASAFIYRGFYAYSSMQRKDGFPTSAIYNITRVLLKLLRTEDPRYFAFVLDGVRESFRHKIFPEYKKNRSKTPEYLLMQIEPIKKIVESFGIPIFVTEDAEADDYIASLSKQYEQDGVIIVGVDKDLRQCLNSHVIMWDPSSKDERIITEESFIEETGLSPSQWPDFQAIIGDSSDNIPGVKGIGEKTARKIFEQYKTLESIEEHIEMLEPKVRNKLENEMQQIYMYRELTRLSVSCCPIKKELLQVQKPKPTIMEYIQEYELHSLRREVEALYTKYGIQKIQKEAVVIESPSKSNQEKQEKDKGSLQLSLFTLKKEDVSFHTIEGIAIDFEHLEKAEKIMLYRTEREIYIGIRETIYHIEEYTEESFLLYMRSVKECNTIQTKELFTHFPALLGYSIQWHDIAIMAYLLSPEERGYTIDTLYAVWNTSLEEETKTVVEFITKITEFFITELTIKGLYELYTVIEQPLCSILVTMERYGICLDIEALENLLRTVEESIEEKEEMIYTMAGKTFNIRSSQQLGNIIFNELGLEHKTKTKTGHFSTSQDTLEKLIDKHPIVEAIIDFRMLEKLRSTYLEPLPKYADSEDRIHTTFNQLITATGRLSSSNPNLQNIPIRGIFGHRIRNCFCAKEGHILVVADYSQIELRILAYLSKEPTLVDAFIKGEDIHKRTASILYDVSIEEVTKEQRQNAKTINFGLLYGMGAMKLAREMKSTLNQAKEFISVYFERLGNVQALHARIIEEASLQGYVSTLFGRRRYLPEIQSRNEQFASQARRQAVNTVIQGTAADIIKKAMVDIAHNPLYQTVEAKLILQIHDELIIEVPKEHGEYVAQAVVKDMESIEWHNTAIPLEVEYGIASRWGDAH